MSDEKKENDSLDAFLDACVDKKLVQEEINKMIDLCIRPEYYGKCTKGHKFTVYGVTRFQCTECKLVVAKRYIPDYFTTDYMKVLEWLAIDDGLQIRFMHYLAEKHRLNFTDSLNYIMIEMTIIMSKPELLLTTLYEFIKEQGGEK